MKALSLGETSRGRCGASRLASNFEISLGKLLIRLIGRKSLCVLTFDVFGMRVISAPFRKWNYNEESIDDP